jgi:AcrR family transcriptional regulator
MSRERPPKSNRNLGAKAGARSKRLRAAPKHDSVTVTRAVPMVSELDVDDLAQTREVQAVSLVGLLDAGEAVISERGFARSTVEDIANRAGVSLDVFHAHFGGKGALLRALSDRFVSQMIGAVDASTRTGSWQSSRVRDVVDIAVRSILEVVDERQGLVRAFLAHGATDRALAAGLRKIGAHMTSRLTHVMRDCQDASEGGASERTVGFALMLGAAIAHHSVLVGSDWSGLGFTREQVAEETTRAISAYLATKTPS